MTPDDRAPAPAERESWAKWCAEIARQYPPDHLYHQNLMGIAAVLRALPASGEGWRLVPVEPTADMIHAVLPMYERMIADSEWPFTVNLWRKMLAAAPPPGGRADPTEEAGR